MSVYWINNGTNLTVTFSGYKTFYATEGRTTGKYYWEIYVENVGGNLIGIADSSVPLTGTVFANTLCRWYYFQGEKTPPRTSYGSTFRGGDTIGVLLDLDNKTLEFFKNGVSQGVAFNDLSSFGEIYPAISTGSSSITQTTTANFGASPFTYVPDTLPAGTMSYDRSQILAEVNKTFILHQGEYKKFSSNWSTVSSTLPTQAQFLSDGMDSIAIINRKLQTLEPIEMTNKTSPLLNNGKLFAKSIDLTKYIDIRKIEVN